MEATLSVYENYLRARSLLQLSGQNEVTMSKFREGRQILNIVL